MNIPVRVQRGGFGKVVKGGAGYDLRAAGGRGEPAGEFITGAGHSRSGRGIGDAVGGGGGLRVRRAAVAIEGDGVGVGGELRNESLGRFRRAGGVAEGVGVAVQRAVGGRGAGPAGEGIAGLYGIGDRHGVAGVAVGAEGTGISVCADGHRCAVKAEQHVAVVDVPVRVNGGVVRGGVVAVEGHLRASIARSGEPAVERIARPRYGGSGGPRGVVGGGTGGVVVRAVIVVIGYGVGLGRPGRGNGILRVGRGTEDIERRGKRAVVARSGPAGEVVAGLRGLGDREGIKVFAVEGMRFGILRGVHGDLAARGIHGDRAGVFRPVRVYLGIALYGVRIGEGHGVGGIACAVVPAGELVAGAGERGRGGPAAVEGNVFSGEALAAVVLVVDDLIGVGSVGSGKGILRAGRGTEGILRGIAVGAGKRTVHIAGEHPGIEGITGLYGFGEREDRVVAARVAGFCAGKRAAVQINVQRALVGIGSIAEGDHQIAGDTAALKAADGVSIAAGIGDVLRRYRGAADRCGNDGKRIGKRVAGTHAEREAYVIAVRYRALYRGRVVTGVLFVFNGHIVNVEIQRLGFYHNIGFTVVGYRKGDGVAGFYAVRNGSRTGEDVGGGIAAGGLGVAVLKHDGKGLVAAEGDGLGLRGGFRSIREVEAGVHPEGDFVFLGGPNGVQVDFGIAFFTGAEVGICKRGGRRAAIVNHGAVRGGRPAVNGVAQTVAEVILGREVERDIVIHRFGLLAGRSVFYVIVINDGIGIVAPLYGKGIGDVIRLAEGINRRAAGKIVHAAVGRTAVFTREHPAVKVITGARELTRHVVGGEGVLGYLDHGVAVGVINVQRAGVLTPLRGKREVIIAVRVVVNALEQKRIGDRVTRVVQNAVGVLPLCESIAGIREAVFGKREGIKQIEADRLAAGGAGSARALIVNDDVGVGRPLRVELDHVILIGPVGQVVVCEGIAGCYRAAGAVFRGVPVYKAVTGLYKAALRGIGVDAERIVNDTLVCGTIARGARAGIILNRVGNGFPLGVELGIRAQRVALAAVFHLGFAGLLGVPALEIVTRARGRGKRYAAVGPVGGEGDAAVFGGGKVYNLCLIGVGRAAEAPACKRCGGGSLGIGSAVQIFIGDFVRTYEAVGRQVEVNVVGGGLRGGIAAGVAVARIVYGVGIGRPDRVQRYGFVLAREVLVAERIRGIVLLRRGGSVGAPADEGISGKRGNGAVKRKRRAVGLGLVGRDGGSTGGGNALAVLGQVAVVMHRVGLGGPLGLQRYVAVFAFHGLVGIVSAGPVAEFIGIGHKPAGEIVTGLHGLLERGDRAGGGFGGGVVIRRAGSIGSDGTETVGISNGIEDRRPLGVQRYVRGGRVACALVARKDGEVRIRIPAREAVAVARGRGQRGGGGVPLGVQIEYARSAHQVLYRLCVGIFGCGRGVHADGVGVPAGEGIRNDSVCSAVAACSVFIIVGNGVFALVSVGGKGFFLVVIEALVCHRFGACAAVAVKGDLIGDRRPLRVQGYKVIGPLAGGVIHCHGSALGISRSAAVGRRVPAREGITDKSGLGGAQRKRGIVGLGLVVRYGRHGVAGGGRLVGIVTDGVGVGRPHGVEVNGGAVRHALGIRIEACARCVGDAAAVGLGVPAREGPAGQRGGRAEINSRAVSFLLSCGQVADRVRSVGGRVGVVIHVILQADPVRVHIGVSVDGVSIVYGRAVAFVILSAALGRAVPAFNGITGAGERGHGGPCRVENSGFIGLVGAAVVLIERYGVVVGRPLGIECDRFFHRKALNTGLTEVEVRGGAARGVRIPARKRITGLGKAAGVGGQRYLVQITAVFLRGGNRAGIGGICVIYNIVCMLYPVCVDHNIRGGIVGVARRAYAVCRSAVGIGVPALKVVAGAAVIIQFHAAVFPHDVELRGAAVGRGQVFHRTLVGVVHRRVAGGFHVGGGPALDVVGGGLFMVGGTGVVLVIGHPVSTGEAVGAEGMIVVVGQRALIGHRAAGCQRAVEVYGIRVLSPHRVQVYGAAVGAGVQIVVTDQRTRGKGGAGAVRFGVPARKGPAGKARLGGAEVHVHGEGLLRVGKAVHVHVRRGDGGLVGVINEFIGVLRPVGKQGFIRRGRIGSVGVADQIAAGGSVVPARERVAVAGGIGQGNAVQRPVRVKLERTGADKPLHALLVVIHLCAGRRSCPAVERGVGGCGGIRAARIIIIVCNGVSAVEAVGRELLRNLVGERLVAVGIAGGAGGSAVAVEVYGVGVLRPLRIQRYGAALRGDIIHVQRAAGGIRGAGAVGLGVPVYKGPAGQARLGGGKRQVRTVGLGLVAGHAGHAVAGISGRGLVAVKRYAVGVRRPLRCQLGVAPFAGHGGAGLVYRVQRPAAIRLGALPAREFIALLGGRFQRGGIRDLIAEGTRGGGAGGDAVKIRDGVAVDVPLGIQVFVLRDRTCLAAARAGVAGKGVVPIPAAEAVTVAGGRGRGNVVCRGLPGGVQRKIGIPCEGHVLLVGVGCGYRAYRGGIAVGNGRTRPGVPALEGIRNRIAGGGVAAGGVIVVIGYRIALGKAVGAQRLRRTGIIGLRRGGTARIRVAVKAYGKGLRVPFGVQRDVRCRRVACAARAGGVCKRLFFIPPAEGIARFGGRWQGNAAGGPLGVQRGGRAGGKRGNV